MGRGDVRMSLKKRRKIRQRKLKARQKRKLETANKTKGK